MPANYRCVQRIAVMARSYVFWGLWVCFRKWSYDVGAGHARESTRLLFSWMVM